MKALHQEQKLIDSKKQQELLEVSKVQKKKNLEDMVKMKYKIRNDTFSLKAANFYADMYVFQEARNGGASKPGQTINEFSKQFLPVEIDGMSRETVFRSIIIKAEVIEKHFFDKVLPNLEDCAICTDGTTLNGIHYDQYFFLGYMNGSEDLRIFVIDVLPTKKSTGAEIAVSITKYVHSFEESCKKYGKVFDVKNLKYLLADHCSNNSGDTNGAIALLRKTFPWIQFLGCKDHLCNLLIKVADTEITNLIIRLEIQKKANLVIKNSFKYKFLDLITRIVKFFTKPSNYAEWKQFAGVDLNVPKTSLNRYLNGTSLCRFVILNYNPIMKFLETHDYKGKTAKKRGLPKKWLNFLRDTNIIECLILCTYLHYNLRKSLGKFHQVTATTDYKKIVSDLKVKFLTLANNPDAFLKRTVALSDHVQGCDINLINSRVKNMLPKLSTHGKEVLKTIMQKMISAKINKHNPPAHQSNNIN